MRPLQQHIIEALGVKPHIDPQGELESRIELMKRYLVKSGVKGFVLGISGGQDSSLLGRMAQLACESLRSEGREATFVAVRLPHGVQFDEDDAQLALSFIKPDVLRTINIAPAVEGLEEAFEAEGEATLSDFNRGNVKARMRMVAQYAIAGARGMLVLGTDHAAEALTGFFTKYGDGGSDLNPLAGLTKGQGRALLKALDAPARLYEKVPTADLLDEKPGQTDESSLGVSYEDIDAYLTGQRVPETAAERIEQLYLGSRHKRHLPVVPWDTWWEQASPA